MKRFLPLVLLVVLAVPIALAVFLGVGRANAPDGTGVATGANTAAPGAGANANAALTAAESAAATTTATAETSARAAIEGGTQRTALSTNASTGIVRGRVIVAPGRSPAGLLIRLRLAIPSVDAIVLGADGAFEFRGLSARTYELEASGLDDIVWRLERYRLRLERGQVIDVDWDLSDRCPSLTDVQLLFDGLPTACTLEPWVDLYREGPPLVTDVAGRARVRLVGNPDNAGASIGQLRLFASNFVRGAEPPAVLRIGQPLDLLALERCTQQPLVVDVRTALVRVLAGEDGSVPLATASGRLSCSISAAFEPTRHASDPAALVWFGKLELDTQRSPMAVFRAGPGSYRLESTAKDGDWHAMLVVRQPGESVDCRLVQR